MLATRERALDSQHPEVSIARYNLAKVLLDRGRPGEARPLLELAWAVQQRADVPAIHRAQTEFALACALWETSGDRKLARRLAEAASQTFVDLGLENTEEAAEIADWLRAH